MVTYGYRRAKQLADEFCRNTPAPSPRKMTVSTVVGLTSGQL